MKPGISHDHSPTPAQPVSDCAPADWTLLEQATACIRLRGSADSIEEVASVTERDQQDRKAA